MARLYGFLKKKKIYERLYVFMVTDVFVMNEFGGNNVVGM